MIKRLCLALALVCWAATAFAQFFPFPGPGVSGTSGGGSPTLAGGVNGVNASCGFATTCAVTVTVTAGTLVVGVSGVNFSGVASSVSAVATTGTCGSVSLTQDVSPSVASGNMLVGLFSGVVSGGSCTITATSSAPGGWNTMGLAAGTLNSLTSNTPTTTCSNNYNNAGVTPFVCSSALTVPSSGYAIAVFSDSSVNTLSSTNMTLLSGASTSATVSVDLAFSTTAGSLTPQFTSAGGTFGDNSLAGATWH